MVCAWFMDDDPNDPHKPHPGAPVALDKLKALGVEYFAIDPINHEAELAAIRKDRGYNFCDEITITRQTFPDYEQKLAILYAEHIHTDDEIRYCKEGSGYFDVRDEKDKWIRVKIEKGDLLIFPKGIYHRYAQDEGHFIVAIRLFEGVPVWTPHNRPADQMDARKTYLHKYQQTQQ